MRRREVIIGAALSLAGGYFPALAQTNSPDDTTMVSELPPLPRDLAANAADPPAPYTETALVGTKPPSQEEIQAAHDILIQSPFGVAPIDVAQYFLAVGAGAYGQAYRSYAREWPVRANPLIFHFFSSTLTKPEGDTTAWCAAFLNWCLLRARATSADEIGKSTGDYSPNGKPFPDENLRKYSTNNASSGSFRCWDELSSPNRGDIAVFKNAGTDALTAVCRGQGHVAFFLSIPRAGRVRVLGGNQSSPGSGGAITVADLGTGPGTRFMKFVSPK
jgi:hypothetical protein